MKLHGLTPLVSSPHASSEQNPPKQKTLRIHPRTYARGFLRRRIRNGFQGRDLRLLSPQETRRDRNLLPHPSDKGCGITCNK